MPRTLAALLGVQVGVNKVLPLYSFERPARITRVFTTVRDNQAKALFQFLMREPSRDGWVTAGRIVVDGLSPQPAGRPNFELTLAPAAAGDVLIELADHSSGRRRRFLLSSSLLQRRRVPVGRLEPAAVVVVAQKPPRHEAGSNWRRFRRPGLIGIAVMAVAGIAVLFLIFALPRMRERRPPVAAAFGRISGDLQAQGRAPAGTIPPAEEQRPPGGGLAGTSVHAAVDGEDPGGEQASVDEAASVQSMQGGKAVGDGGIAGKESGTGEASSDVMSSASPTGSSSRSNPADAAEQSPEREQLLHRIRWGDTLWRITERYYGNPYLYPLLAVENDITNPNLIIPGTEIRLPEKIDEKQRKDRQ